MNGGGTEGEVSCPVCEVRGARNEGRIPAADRFAGNEMVRPIPGGCLYRCEACNFGFRWGRENEDAIADRYHTESGRWQNDFSKRRDWQRIATWIAADSRDGERILEVGCNDGTFLATLKERYRCFGVEVNPQAVARAQAAGIEVLGADLGKLVREKLRFDWVVAIDVLEHVRNPLAMLETMAELAGDHGSVIGSTGNLDHWTWRLMGSRYWYCTVPEHISFLNESWLRWAASRLGMSVEAVCRLSPGEQQGFATRITDVIKNISYRMTPAVWAFARRRGLGRRNALRWPELQEYPPGWTTARDHFVFLLRDLREEPDMRAAARTDSYNN